MNTSALPDRTTTNIRRVARIWSIIVLAIGIFIFGTHIFEPTTGDIPLIETLQPIALFIGIIGLALAWRWECLGGAAAIGFAVLTPILYLAGGGGRPAIPFMLALSVIIPGALFLICWWRSR